ncbi:MAG: hypothetical protein V7727_13455 [Sneathiella sp.]
MDKSHVWVRTFGGGVLHPFNPNINEIKLTDIIWPLAKTCRYNGGIKNRRDGAHVRALHYSVAEHSVLMAQKLLLDFPDRPELAFQGLMHDAAEAYVGDLVSPIKDVMPEFRDVEDGVLKVIFEKFEIEFPLSDVVKEYDTRILLDEVSAGLNPGDWDFGIEAEPLWIDLKFWTASTAFEEFVQMFGQLRAKIEVQTEEAAA